MASHLDHVSAGSPDYLLHIIGGERSAVFCGEGWTDDLSNQACSVVDRG